jgi:dihydrofolate synthase / folylpolyglutamate synthase
VPAPLPSSDRAPPGALDAFLRARDYVDRDVVRLTPRRRDPEGKVRAARAFNAALGDPQAAYPSIQVAGTSGKGSVSAALASALSAAGLRTGLHVSPYLQVITEKTWIDGRYVAPDDFARAVDTLRPVAEDRRRDDDLPASVHGLASLGASYLSFAEAGLDVAVIETGVGGRYDLVQGLRRCLSVVTDLGLDHQQALGATLEEIAWHKAGIMEPGVPCVAVRGPGWSVLEAEARRLGVELVGVDPGEGRVEDGHLQLELPSLGSLSIPLETRSPITARNLVLAARGLDALASRGWAIEPRHLVAGLGRRVLPGRLERAPEPGHEVLLDGAHNPQKAAALARHLATLGGEPWILVVAGTGSRPPGALLDALAPSCSRVVACQLDLYGKSVLPADDLARAARGRGLTAEVVLSPQDALEEALGLGSRVLVTGSFYLLGLARERWYPWERVLHEGTSWPLPIDRAIGSAP